MWFSSAITSLAPSLDLALPTAALAKGRVLRQGTRSNGTTGRSHQMTFISFTRDLEDALVIKALTDLSPGFYVDVGPKDPIAGSLTRGLHLVGWRGVHIVEDQLVDAFVRDRPSDRVVAASTLTAGQDRPLTLHDVAAAADLDEVHLLSLCLDECTAPVLGPSDFKTFRPWIVLVRSSGELAPRTGQEGWARVIDAQGYDAIYDTGRSRFFVPRERAALAARFRAGDQVLQVSQVVLAGASEGATPDELETFVRRAADAEQKAAVAEEGRFAAERLAAERRRCIEALRKTLEAHERERADDRLEIERLQDLVEAGGAKAYERAETFRRSELEPQHPVRGRASRSPNDEGAGKAEPQDPSRLRTALGQFAAALGRETSRAATPASGHRAMPKVRGPLRRALLLPVRKVLTAIAVARLDRDLFWHLVRRSVGLERSPEQPPADASQLQATVASPAPAWGHEASAAPRDRLIAGLRQDVARTDPPSPRS